MAIIAVAGGTGGIGRAIVEAIVRRGKHNVKVLSRKANDSLADEIGAPIIPVDYSDVDSLTRALEEHEIDTVISSIFTMPVSGIAPEVALIRASQSSKTTRRFIPSNWGVPLDKSHEALTPSVPMKLLALDELKKTDLEYTVFYVGFLLDYYTGPSIKSYMSPLIVVIDMECNIAAIPGSGNTPIAFTHSLDVGKYVDASLDLKKWDASYRIIGDKATWNEFVKLAEIAKGTQFTIVHDSVEDLKKGKVTLLPSTKRYLSSMSVNTLEGQSVFLSTFGLLFEDGTFDLEEKGALNRLLPEIGALKIKQAVEAAVNGV
ncbi:NAD(P)-binding protein [Aspergillus pseudoustus]|uniref:NAD(P)-binding protein n=1 Tax=Aspergillus pseudoustus TaxID=1810923 RepID=A0ABR4K4B7_9EURO